MSRTRVLVTGSAGWIGTRLRPLMESDGAEVVTDPAAGAIDACIHLAWIARPPDYATSAKNWNCVSDSLALFARMAAAGCKRFVGVGTCWEYAPSDAPLGEQSPLGPRNLYAICKDIVRSVLEVQAVRWPEVRVAWARIFQPYGPGEHPARLVPTIARSLLAGEPCIVSTGTQVRDFVHVDDVARALWTIATSDHTGPINIGSSTGTSVARVAQTMGDLVGAGHRLRIGYGDIPGEPPHIVADTERLRSLGWAPRYTLREGLRDTVDWWRAEVRRQPRAM